MIRSLPFDLFFLAAILLASIGIGKKILRLLHLIFPSTGLELVAASGAGLACVSYFVIALGFFGLIYRPILFGFLALSILCYLSEIKSILASFKNLRAFMQRSISSRFDAFLWIVIGVAVISNLVFNYAPPTQGREIWYDLTLPKIYLENHRIVDVPDQMVSYYPLQIQMLYLFAMGIKSALVAKLIHLSLGIFSMLLIYFLAEFLFNSRAALISSAIFYLMPLVTSCSGAANIDLGTLFYGLLTLMMTMLWMRSNDWRSLMLAGFFSGVAAGTKVVGITVPMALAVTVFLYARFEWKESFGKILKSLAGIGLFAFIAVSPWPLRNYRFTGNPAAPFAVQSLGLKGHEEANVEMGMVKALQAQLKFSDYLKGYHHLLYGEFIYGAGPLLFAFLPFGFLLPSQRKEIFWIFLMAMLNFILLHLMLPFRHRFYETRYYIVTYGILTLVAGCGVEAALASIANDRWLKLTLSAIILFPCLMFNLLMSVSRVPVFIGRQSREAYIDDKIENHPLFDFANKNLPSTARILEVGGGGINYYYWNARVIHAMTPTLRESDTQEILSWLKSEGITHVLYFKGLYQEKKAGESILRNTVVPDFDLYWNMDELTEKYFKKIFEYPSYSGATLYEIQYP